MFGETFILALLPSAFFYMYLYMYVCMYASSVRINSNKEFTTPRKNEAMKIFN